MSDVRNERRGEAIAVYGLFIASGATALVYQVTWFRNLSLIFGTSFEATSIVLAAFMAGLSLGGFTGGRLSTRIARPLRVYGILEWGIAGAALVLPALLRGIDGLYVATVMDSETSGVLLTLARSTIAFVVLVVPTFLMGATLPLLTRALVHDESQFAGRVAWLYGSNTLGAVIGALAAGFVLMPALGVWRSQLCAVALNLAIGAVAFAVDRRPVPAASAAEDVPASGGASASAAAPDALALRLAFAGTALSGMCSLALEVMWTRALAISVGSTVYSFTVMLAAFLSGIWIGSWLHALFPLRRVHESIQFGTALLLAGIASLATSLLIPHLPELAVRLNFDLYRDLGRIRPGTTLLLAFGVMLVPCVFIGAAFPLANRARARLVEGFGRPVGDTLGLNTLGAIVGSLGAGFVLIPFLGLQQGMLLASALYLSYGAIVVAALFVALRPSTRWVTAAVTAVFVLCALALPRVVRPWELDRFGTYLNNQLRRYVNARGDFDFASGTRNMTLQYYRQGRVATIAVAEEEGERSLSVNGKIVASDMREDMQTQLMLGHIPVLMHPDPKTVLVVGMGTGVTLGAVAAHEELEEITLAEIEPAVLDATRLFSAANGDPLDDPRLRVHLEDGRNFLKTTAERFDVITADPIHPWTRGSGYLFTREYYTLAASRLGENGVMCQWLPVGEFSLADFQSIVASFAEIFPHTMLWHNRSVALIGSHAPLRVDFENLERRLEQPRVARQLAGVGLDDVYSLVADLVLADAHVRAFVDGAIINTDDNLYLEFSSPLSLGGSRSGEIVNALNHLRDRTDPFDITDPELQALMDRHRNAKSATMGVESQRGSPRDKARAERRLQNALEDLPSYGPGRLALADRLSRQAAGVLNQRRPQQVEALARRAVALAPEFARAHRILGVALAQQSEFAEAIASLERARELKPRHWLTHFYLSEALEKQGETAQALTVLREGLDIQPDNPRMNAQLERLEHAHRGG